MRAAVIGFILDLCLGDPHSLWHPVRGIGWLIQALEGIVRRIFPKDEKGLRIAGSVLVILVLAITGVVVSVLLWISSKIHPFARLAAESVMCYQLLAVKSLKDESMKVWKALQDKDLEGARKAVSMIVGRDTACLTEEGIIRAAVETVAENTSDGVAAPLFYIAILGPLGGFLYKAVNTMDSMIGYKNERYLYFGRAAARLDDLLNYLPARLSAVLMILGSFLLGYDGKNAVKIFRRDRYQHKSPNSAQTEAVCAGALSIRLAGDAYYFGTLYQKPAIGDDIRPVEAEDIRRANRLLYITALFMLLLEVGIWYGISMGAIFTARI